MHQHIKICLTLFSEKNEMNNSSIARPRLPKVGSGQGEQIFAPKQERTE
jgi:hypothetical protein